MCLEKKAPMIGVPKKVSAHLDVRTGVGKGSGQRSGKVRLGGGKERSRAVTPPKKTDRTEVQNTSDYGEGIKDARKIQSPKGEKALITLKGQIKDHGSKRSAGKAHSL